MYKIVRKKFLNPTVVQMEIESPFVAKKAKPGQFIILRVDEDGERIPLTVAGTNKEEGTTKIIFQVVGATTEKLKHKEEGEYISDFVGPLGVATHTEGIKRVCIIGGGVGCAIAMPVAQEFHRLGAKVTSIIGFRNKDLLIMEDMMRKVATNLYVCTDDGSYGFNGNVTKCLKDLVENKGKQYNHAVAIGPMIMMKFACLMTKELNIPTIVSMNPIMVDGTGMCGACRLQVGDEIKFACVDGPEFDGHLVDFDQAMKRQQTYKTEEGRAMLKLQEGDTHHGGCGNCGND